ncbi:hypothetical protein G6F35_013076 [Rhizopus arrhizus]|nr:hypothetical protein G6F35_013076 [Rhizopus arrhizus]
MRLDRKQRHQHDQRDRHHPPVQRMRHDPDAFQCRQHGDRGRDHAVAIEQRRAKNAQHDQHPAHLAFTIAHRQLQQRQRTAFAAVVGAQHQRHVLQGHHHHQHPEQDGQHAQQMRRLQVGMHAQARQAGAQGVQRAGADVAIHHAQRAHDERRARRGRVRASRMRPGR